MVMDIITSKLNSTLGATGKVTGVKMTAKLKRSAKTQTFECEK